MVLLPARLAALLIPAYLKTLDPDIVYECPEFAVFRVDAKNPSFSSDGIGVLYNKEKTVLLRAPQMLKGSYQIPDTVTELGYRAFENCRELTKVTLPEGLTSLPAEAFYNCEKLQTVVFGKHLKAIGYRAFMGCDALTLEALPESVTLIDSYAFAGCEGLKKIHLHDGITTIGVYAFAYCDHLETFSWPRGVSAISANAFDSCDSLKEVNIPDTVTAIGERAFDHCCYLTRVTIPATVTEIDQTAFIDCSRLTDLQVAPGNPSFFSDERSVLFTADKKTLLYAPGGLSGSYEIPEGTTTIAELAFLRCSNLTQVTIPASVTTIGKNAIYGNNALTCIRVADASFNYSSDAAGVLFNKDKTVLIVAPALLGGSYQVPETVTEIREQAFRFTQLSTISLPASLTKIGRAAFADVNLKKACYSGTKEQWRQVSLDEGNEKLTKIPVFCGSAKTYDLNSDGKPDADDAIHLLHTMFGDPFYPLS